jgi:hypothetical protein
MAPWVWPCTISGLMQRPTDAYRVIITAPVSGSTPSQIAQPLRRPVVHLLSVTTAMPSEVVGELAAEAACASSRKSKLRLVSREVKRPSSVKSMLFGGTFKTTAAILPFAIRSSWPLKNGRGMALERPECEPPPTFTTSVSPR